MENANPALSSPDNNFQIFKREDKKRSDLFDFLKLIAMSYVLIGHVLQRWYVSNFTSSIGFALFYSVSLSLFFLVGGFFVNRSSTLKGLLKYLLKLLVLYIVPAYLFTCLSIWFLPRFADHDFAYWMNELYLRTDTFYWFFLTAFFINAAIAISFYVGQLLFKKINLLNDVLITATIIVLLIAFSYIFIHIYNHPDLGPALLSANMLLYYLPISLCGFLIKTFAKYVEKWRGLKILRLVIFAISLIGYSISLFYFQNWIVGLSGSFLDVFYRLIGSLCGVLTYYYLSLFLTSTFRLQKIAMYGKYSGPFYLVHVFLIRLLASYLPRPTLFDQSTIIFIIFLTIGFYLGSLGITIFLVEIPLTDFLLFGNYRRLKKLSILFRSKKRSSI